MNWCHNITSYLLRLFHLSRCLHKFVKLVTRESARFDNNGSEPKSQVRLLKFPEQNKNFQRHVLSKAFCHSSNVRMRTNAFREGATAEYKVEGY